MKPLVGNPATTNDVAGALEIAQLQLLGCLCRVLCVDDVLPQHQRQRQGSRPRLLYAPGEVAHFEVGGHTYSLVIDPVQTEEVPRIGPDCADVPGDIRDLLTQRELQIVQLVCMGSPAKQVAHFLGLSEFTVRSYLKTIYCKLGVRSRGAMAYRYAQAFQRAPRP